MKKYFVFLLSVAFFVSCKKKEQKNPEPIIKQQKKVEEKLFIITYKCKFSENDNLQLFYTEDFKLHYSDKLSLRKNVKASEDFTKVEFKLPQGVIPDRLRFDLGGNRNQKRIEFEEISIKYKKDSIIINKENLLQMLILNDNLDYDEGTNIITPKVINVDGKEIYDPYFYCSNELVKLLYNL